MKLGISTYTYTWAVGISNNMPEHPMNLEDLFVKARELDVGLIQVADNMPADRMSDSELEGHHEAAEALGIEIETGGRGMTESSLEKHIHIAEKLHSPLLRFVIDGQDYKPDMDTILGIISNALPVLEQKNIVLAIENYERFRTRDFANIIERTGSDYVGICLDSVNSLGAGEGIQTVVEMLGPLTVNLHIKEFTIKRITVCRRVRQAYIRL